MLAVCLLIATVFVLLSRWQLESADAQQTVFDPGKEIVRPLEETVTPGQLTTVEEADRAVEATGRYLPDSTVLVENRLQDGREGWWVVAGLQIPGTQQQWEGADADAVLPVVRGWTADPAEIPEVPEQEIAVTGRFLPQEAPLSTQDRDPGTFGSLSPAQLGNVWDAPVYSGFVTAVGENPAAQGPLTDDDGALPEQGEIMAPQLEPVAVDQQPTDESLDPLNIFYAVEWVVFACFALWIWFSTVRDDHRRQQDPAAWFDLDGESLPYAWDERAQRFYYYDPVAEEYYYFDDEPQDAHQPEASAQDGAPAQDHRGAQRPQSGEQR